MRNFVQLRKGKDQSLKRKHLWVFSGAIKNSTEELTEGEVVDVLDKTGEFMGIGYYHSGMIAVRIFEWNKVENLDDKYWKNKIGQIVAHRIDLGFLSNIEKTNVFRLCHAEGDGIPGLIIDFYNGVAVIQCHTLGILNFVNNIATALLQFEFITTVYNKSNQVVKYGNSIEDSIVGGQTIDLTSIHVKENNIPFTINLKEGQKTGFFIDQRDNRILLSKYAAGKKILNTFCYTGGFTLHALSTGADKVTSVDSSEHAIAELEQNINLLGTDAKDKHTSVVADAVKYVRNLEDDFDIVILDPPAFAKNVKSRHNAIQAYKRLNSAAMKSIKQGGIIFTFSCSQVVTKELFQKTIYSAALESKRRVQILHYLSQPTDHTINIYHKESEYLKGLVLKID